MQGDTLADARRVQLIFQDPISSLNPVAEQIGASVAAPLLSWGDGSARAEATGPGSVAAVGLDPQLSDGVRNGISGGQCQRVPCPRGRLFTANFSSATSRSPRWTYRSRAQIPQSVEGDEARLGSDAAVHCARSRGGEKARGPTASR